MPSSPVTLYDSSGRDRLALSAWKVMFRELFQYRELILRLFTRNIVGQFRQSYLGYLWIILPPIATAAAFSFLQSARIMNIQMPEGGLPYPVFVILGATVWQFFTQVVMMSTACISNAGGLVSKIYFPREVLVLSATGNAFLNLAVRAVVVVLTCLLFGYGPAWPAVFSLLLMIPLAALGLGIGYFLAPVNTMMNDVSRFIEFLFGFGMFLAPTVFPTPVLTSASGVWEQALFWAHQVNPVSHYLYAVHSLFQTGSIVFTAGLQVSLILSFLLFFTGWRFFHICEPLLAERL